MHWLLDFFSETLLKGNQHQLLSTDSLRATYTEWIQPYSDALCSYLLAVGFVDLHELLEDI